MSEKKKIFILAAVSCLVALLLAELVLRCCVDQETKRLAVFDEDLGWRGRPRGEGVYIRHRDSIRVPFRYNALGFRDEEVTSRQAGELRVLLLGDSFLESLEVPYELTFHELFEERLNAEFEQLFSVINVSSQGYSTAQEILALRKFGEVIDPDIILLIVYTGNDFKDNLRSDFVILDEAGRIQYRNRQLSSFAEMTQSSLRWLYEQSHLVFFLKNTYESLTSHRIAAAGKQISGGGREQQERLMELLLEDARAEAVRQGAAFGVVVIPAREEIRKGESWRARFVRAVLAGSGVPCLDLSADLMPEHFFAYDEHLNPDGHAVTASGLYEFFVTTYLNAGGS